MSTPVSDELMLNENVGNIAALGPFCLHADETRASRLFDIAGLGRFRARAIAARPGYSAAADCAARAEPSAKLCADGKGRRGAWGTDHRSEPRATQRPACAIRRRLVPARRCRSRNPCAHAGCRQDACDPAARQPRRRPVATSEMMQPFRRREMAQTRNLAPSSITWPGSQLCLTGNRPAPYMPRVRKVRGRCRPPPNTVAG